MAYLRWDDHNRWYIFWHVSDAMRKEDELIAIWHAADDRLPEFKYSELVGKNFDEFKRIVKIDCATDEELRVAYYAVQQWIRDVDREYSHKETLEK